MKVEPDDLAVEAMMALIDAVYGELRNPTQLRAHVSVIIGASEDLGSDDMEAWEQATTTLRAYVALPSPYDPDRS